MTIFDKIMVYVSEKRIITVLFNGMFFPSFVPESADLAARRETAFNVDIFVLKLFLERKA